METTHSSIRLLTINSWKGDGEYTWRMQLMARELYSLMPDIICIQECVRSDDGQIDTADFLADYLGMEYVFCPARWKKRKIDHFEHNCHSGLAILSRYGFESSRIDSLPSEDADGERLALTTKIFTETELFTITNLHLTHLKDAERLRRKQLHSVFERNREAIHSGLWFCMGDFNENINEDIRSEIGRDHRFAITDCYLAGDGELPGSTLVSSKPDGDTRIDHILLLQNPDNPPITFANGKVVMDEPDFEGCFPSDHFGVMVDVVLKSTGDRLNR